MNKKFLCTLCTLLFLAACSAIPMNAAAGHSLAPSSDECDVVAWQSWKTKYAKVYAWKQEDSLRCRVFMQNVAAAQALQSHQHSPATTGSNTADDAVYGATKFSDMSPAEFRATRLTFKQHAERTQLPVANVSRSSLGVDALPAEVDWRVRGAVTAVKDQGDCGSCWTFSTTGDVEGSWFVLTGELKTFSEQYILDCHSNSQGCDGGDPASAMKVLENSHGLPSESDYPYRGNSSKAMCPSHLNIVAGNVCRVEKVPPTEADIMTYLVQHGPLSVSLNAGHLQHYRSGIADPPVCSPEERSIDHAVLLVGYGVDNASGKKYWVVKNSWSASWGEDGFFRIVRGVDRCGIERDAVHAITCHA